MDHHCNMTCVNKAPTLTLIRLAFVAIAGHDVQWGGRRFEAIVASSAPPVQVQVASVPSHFCLGAWDWYMLHAVCALGTTTGYLARAQTCHIPSLAS